MTDIIIAGIGQTPVGEHWDTSLRELAYYAMAQAIEDSGYLRPQALFVGNMLADQLSSQAHLGALLADFAGLTGIEAYTIEAAGASGAAALRQAYLAVKSGLVDVALAVGVEKISDQIGNTTDAALASATDGDYEAVHGMTLEAQAALLMRRYLYESGAPRSAFAALPLIAHANAVGNPNAMFRKAIRPEVYENAAITVEPLNMFDIAPWADGAAAVLLARRDLLPPKYPHPLVQVAGSALATDRLALHDRPDMLDFYAARLSMQRACAQAGINPQDADFFELYDHTSITAVLSLEAAGFAPRGEGWRLAQECSLQGRFPVATFGGLKARGNPGGATGLYQVVEAALQLREQAGPNQVASPRWGVTQALGGQASTAVTHVLTRLQA
ncbi:MAG: thiolase domain-containing protein [Anaerolineae bacterium]|nr:MAG: thiolase domain-containing protein [Anaerolineae bacterium]